MSVAALIGDHAHVYADGIGGTEEWLKSEESGEKRSGLRAICFKLTYKSRIIRSDDLCMWVIGS